MLPRDALRPQHLLGQSHVLSTAQHAHLFIRLLPLSSLPTATSMPLFPGSQYPRSALHLCKSYHPSRPNSNPTSPQSLSNYPNTLNSPLLWAVILPFSEMLPHLQYAFCLAFSGMVPQCFRFVCLVPLLGCMFFKIMLYLSYICQSTIILGF